MADTQPTPTPTNTDTPASGDNPQAGLLGSLQGFFASMNPIYGFLAAATSTDIKEVVADPSTTFRDIKMNVGSFIVDASLVVLGVVALFFAVTVAIGQDKLSAVSGLIKVAE